MKEDGLNISKIILFGSNATRTNEKSDINITNDAEIKTIKKFMVPLDIITLISEEFENETSLVAEFAKRGKVMFAA